MGGVQAVGGAMSASAKQKQAEEQNALNQQQLALRQQQEEDAASAKIQGYQREARGAIGGTINRASEGGIGGNTLAALTADLQSQEAVRENYVQLNLKNTNAQIDLQKEASEKQMEATKAANDPMSTLIIGGLGAVMNGFGAFNKASTAGSAGSSNALTKLLEGGI